MTPENFQLGKQLIVQLAHLDTVIEESEWVLVNFLNQEGIDDPDIMSYSLSLQNSLREKLIIKRQAVQKQFESL